MGGLRKGKSEERYKAGYKIKDFYRFYKQEYFIRSNSKKVVLADNPYDVGYKTYREIIDRFNKGLVDLIIDKAKDIIIYPAMGTIGIRKNKNIGYIDPSNDQFVSTRPVDWNLTYNLWKEDSQAKENKKLIRHKNSHSFGYCYKLKYLNKGASYPFKNEYTFIPTRTFKLRLRDKIKEGGQDYLLEEKSYREVYSKEEIKTINKIKGEIDGIDSK